MAIIGDGAWLSSRFMTSSPDVRVDTRVETSPKTPVHRFSFWRHVECLGDPEAEIGDELYPAGQCQKSCDRSIIREPEPIDPKPLGTRCQPQVLDRPADTRD